LTPRLWGVRTFCISSWLALGATPIDAYGLHTQCWVNYHPCWRSLNSEQTFVFSPCSLRFHVSSHPTSPICLGCPDPPCTDKCRLALLPCRPLLSAHVPPAPSGHHHAASPFWLGSFFLLFFLVSARSRSPRSTALAVTGPASAPRQPAHSRYLQRPINGPHSWFPAQPTYI